MSDKRIGGTLNYWKVRSFMMSTGMEPAQCIVGELEGDDQWDDGQLILSSIIIKLDEVNKTVETKNTIYKLGIKA